MEKLTIKFENTEVVRALTPNARVHWRVKAALSRQAKEQAWLALLGEMSAKETNAHDFLTREGTQPRVASYPLRMTCTRYFSGRSRWYDDDNLTSSFKPFRDGVVAALGVDDAPKYVQATYRQERVAVGKWLVIEVELAPVVEQEKAG